MPLPLLNLHRSVLSGWLDLLHSLVSCWDSGVRCASTSYIWWSVLTPSGGRYCWFFDHISMPTEHQVHYTTPLLKHPASSTPTDGTLISGSIACHQGGGIGLNMHIFKIYSVHCSVALVLRQWCFYTHCSEILFAKSNYSWNEWNHTWFSYTANHNTLKTPGKCIQGMQCKDNSYT